MGKLRWHNFADAEAVAGETLRRVLAAAQQAIEERGGFRLVLAGGSTPERAYRQLASAQADWARWQLYLGDERCLPRGDAGRNSTLIERAWLADGRIPRENIHWIPAELGAGPGADAYQDTLATALPFDLVLLGMGEDGHTASLFPHRRYDPARLVVAVHDAPKPPPERISLTPRALCQSGQILLLVTGAGKREAVRRWRAGEALPVAGLQCPNGVDVLIDRAAAG